MTDRHRWNDRAEGPEHLYPTLNTVTLKGGLQTWTSQESRSSLLSNHTFTNLCLKRPEYYMHLSAAFRELLRPGSVRHLLVLICTGDLPFSHATGCSF